MNAHPKATHVIFWDVDTQRDFMEPGGALFVPGAPEIVSNLEQLTRCARERGVPVVASMDDHTSVDPEISDRPDFRVTFPPHCMRGTAGQQPIAATAPKNPLYIENRPYTRTELADLLRAHRGEIFIKKQAISPFTNPATATLVELLAPETVIVYGVCADFCVHQTVMGLADGMRRVCVVRDAIRAIDAEEARRCEAEWRRRGVEMVSTADVVAGRVVRLSSRH